MEGYDDDGVGIQPEEPREPRDGGGGTPLEELLGKLDWARLVGDDESVQRIQELIMLTALQQLAESQQVVAMHGTPAQGTILLMAIDACGRGGYLSENDSALLDYLGTIPKGLVQRDESGRAFFPELRKRARYLDRQKKHNAKRRQTTKASSNDESVVKRRVCMEEEIHTENFTNTEESVIGIPLRPAGARSVVPPRQGTLFPEEERAAGPPTRKPQAWDPVFDAIVEVCGADNRPTTRAHVAKVSRDLVACVPPYTADEVRQLVDVLARQTWWKPGMMISPQIVQKHIGLVRSSALAETAVPLKPMSLAELEAAAIQSYRDAIQEGR